MEDPRWLRFITIGLVLAALAVGYFLISGKFVLKNNTTKKPAPVIQINPTATSSASPASVLGQNAQFSPSPTSASAYNRIVSRNQTAQTLPRTGFPAGLAAVLSISAIISGWGLRKFPR